jgi:hypothetical protein
VRRGEIAAGAEARRVPLDAFGDGRVEPEQHAPQRLDRVLVRVIERLHERVDGGG